MSDINIHSIRQQCDKCNGITVWVSIGDGKYACIPCALRNARKVYGNP